MNTHVTEELPRLLTGEATRDAVLDAAAHLRTCVDCQHELVSAVVAHASLTSAQRFAPEVVATPPAETAPPQLPDLAAVFAQVETEAARRPRRRTRYLIGAAAAAVVVGGGIATAVVVTGSSAPGGQTVHLAAYDEGRTDAQATLAGGEMRIDATSLPRLNGKGYEVWLTNAGRTDMKPVGWIGSNGRATLSVPSALMDKYTDIEVSVQDVSAPSYLYSKVSVLRGDYG